MAVKTVAIDSGALARPEDEDCRQENDQRLDHKDDRNAASYVRCKHGPSVQLM